MPFVQNPPIDAVVLFHKVSALHVLFVLALNEFLITSIESVS